MTTDFSKYICTTCIVAEEKFELHPLKAIYWKKENTLIISDLHLGKAKHFVKAGIALPAKALEKKNLEHLNILTNHYQPSKIIFLGDLFHSVYNKAWDRFCEYTSKFPAIEFILVEGNHDFLEEKKYEEAKLRVVAELVLKPFIFTHEPLESQEAFYNLAGHIHPGVRLIGPAKQSNRFPCFYFGKKGGLLPAFGAFTGLMILSPKKKDQVFIVSEDEVIATNHE